MFHFYPYLISKLSQNISDIATSPAGMDFPYWEFSSDGTQVGLGEFCPIVSHLDSPQMMGKCNDTLHKVQIITPVDSCITGESHTMQM